MFLTRLMRLSLAAYGLGTMLMLVAMGIGRTLPAERILFLSSQEDTRRIYAMDIRQGLIHKTSDTLIAGAYSLSPDGQQILYVQSVDNQLPTIFIMDADGKNRQQLVEQGIGPIWSPDSQSVVFNLVNKNDGSSQISRINVDGTDRQALTDSASQGQLFPVGWSPDGIQLLFLGMRPGNQLNLYVMNAEGGALSQLASEAQFDTFMYPEWSPDNQYMGLVGQSVDHNRGDITSHLCIEHLESAGVECFDDNIAGPFAWSPDSASIAFITSDGFDIFEIDILDVKTKEIRQVLRYGESTGVQWVGFPIWTGDGQHLIYEFSKIANRYRDTQLHIINIDGSSERNLTEGMPTSILPSWWAGN
ncbi:MAG: hypothetical protein ABI690_26350 [Chloroflexota bacterium]